MLPRLWCSYVLIASLAVLRCTPAPLVGEEVPYDGGVAKRLDSLVDTIINIDSDGYIIDPYKGQPFKEGDTLTRKLVIDIGNLPVRGSVKYVLKETDGIFFHFRNTYHVEVFQVSIDSTHSAILPKDLKSGIESISDIEMTAEDIIRDTFSETTSDYLMCVRDFNMDGRPDFAFEADQGFHSSERFYYIWVNIKGKLCYWQKISDVNVFEDDFSKRQLSTIYFVRSDSPVIKYYRVVKDTTLIPIKVKE